MKASSTGPQLRRLYLPGLSLVALLYVVFLFPRPEFPLFNADDGSFFVTLALNLLDHGRYTVDGFPFADYGHHATWPPVFPLLLAAVIAAVGLHWWALKLLMVMSALAALYFLLRFWDGEEEGAWAVLLTALSPAFFLFAHHTMSEVPYLAAVAASLWAIQRARTWPGALGAGLVAALAFLTRGYAVTLLPAALLYYLGRGGMPWGRRMASALAFALPLVLAIGAWKAYTDFVAGHFPLDYITQRFGTGGGLLSEMLRSPMAYVQRLWWHDGRYPLVLMVPVVDLREALHNDLLALSSLALLGLCALGWWSQVRRRVGILEIWLPIALAFQFVPRETAARYWLTFVPFLFYYLLRALGYLQERLGSRLPLRKAGLVLLLGAGAAGLGMHLLHPERLRFVDPDLIGLRDLALWAGDHLPADATVVTRHWHRFYAVSRRNTLTLDQLQAHLQEVLDTGRPLYLVCRDGAGAVSCPTPGPALLHHSGGFGLVRQGPVRAGRR